MSEGLICDWCETLTPIELCSPIDFNSEEGPIEYVICSDCLTERLFGPIKVEQIEEVQNVAN